MQSQALNCHFRTIVLTGMLALLTTSAALPMAAQSSGPPTAVQAARTQPFASRLARPATGPASRRNHPAPEFRGYAPDGIIYSNGSTDGETNAWVVSYGTVVSDTFVVSSSTNVSGMTFEAWLFPGDALEFAEVSITSQPNGGTVYYDQFLSFIESSCSNNQFGLNVCAETSQSFVSPTLPPGTYWVNLQNATTQTGDPVYWDQNSGPSMAYSSSVGTIPSESFTLVGDNPGPPSCFLSQGKLQAIFNFTQQQGGGNGVAIDQAGNLYGTNPNGGSHSDGLAYKLSSFTGWLFGPLFNFLGGDTGGQPSGAILGPNGTLYGGAQGGIQNCGTDGSQYCGIVFNLRPRPTVCLTALCGWNDNVLYRFSSESDGSGTINASAFDQSGNLYGTTTTGGTNGEGTVFELTPSDGGWTKTTLYSFTGHADGYSPTQVLVGNDGNVYGIASGGLFHGGVVFKLTPSGGQWTQSILYPFGAERDSTPGYLVQDSAGNLYGIVQNFVFTDHGEIFTLQKTGSGWAFSQFLVDHNEFDTLINMTVDTTGNLYGTGFDQSNFSSVYQRQAGGGVQTHDSYIFKASYDSNGWHYQDLRYLSNEYFPTGGSLALDASGNLYGTTSQCQTSNYGTVWKLSP